MCLSASLELLDDSGNSIGVDILFIFCENAIDVNAVVSLDIFDAVELLDPESLEKLLGVICLLALNDLRLVIGELDTLDLHGGREANLYLVKLVASGRSDINSQNRLSGDVDAVVLGDLAVLVDEETCLCVCQLEFHFCHDIFLLIILAVWNRIE